MTEGQPKGVESLLFKALVRTFGIFEYCSSHPCLDPGIVRTEEGPGQEQLPRTLIIDTDVWKCVLCASWTICCAETDRAMFISDTF